MTASPAPVAALPVEAALPALRAALTTHSRCLLVAQPGAGKTTRVPLDLLQADPSGHSRWLLLEPRRVAARLAAGYMAEQLGEALGQTVGYRVRGESRVSAVTRVEVVTQGILTRMLQEDPSLEGITGIIFDEFHERSLEADLGLALALDVQQGLREDLQLLIMSATLDAAAFTRYFDGAKAAYVQARTAPACVAFAEAGGAGLSRGLCIAGPAVPGRGAVHR